MTTLFLRDSVEELPAFTVCLNGISLNRRNVEKSIACVQSFVRSPRFTQRDFFSDNGVNLLVSAIDAAGSIRDQSNYEPWANVLPEGYEATLVDLRKAYDAVVVRRKEHGTHQREGSECAAWSHLKLGSHLVVLECGYPMLLRLDRLITCLGLYLLGISLVVVLQNLLEALEKENVREVWHLLPLLAPNDCSNLITSQLFCQREEGCILKTPILNAL